MRNGTQMFGNDIDREQTTRLTSKSIVKTNQYFVVLNKLLKQKIPRKGYYLLQ